MEKSASLRDPRSPENKRKHDLLNKIWMAKKAIQDEKEASERIQKSIQEIRDKKARARNESADVKREFEAIKQQRNERYAAKSIGAAQKFRPLYMQHDPEDHPVFKDHILNRSLKKKDTFIRINPMYMHEPSTCFQMKTYTHAFFPSITHDIEGRPLRNLSKEYNHKMDPIKIYSEEMYKLGAFAPPPRKAAKLA